MDSQIGMCKDGCSIAEARGAQYACQGPCAYNGVPSAPQKPPAVAQHINPPAAPQETDARAGAREASARLGELLDDYGRAYFSAMTHGGKHHSQERANAARKALCDFYAAPFVEVEERTTGAHWVFDATQKMRPYLDRMVGPRPGHVDIHPCRKQHLSEMIDKVTPGAMSATKACRWLGWIQASIVAAGAASLDTMKEINKAASCAPSRNVERQEGGK